MISMFVCFIMSSKQLVNACGVLNLNRCKSLLMISLLSNDIQRGGKSARTAKIAEFLIPLQCL